MSNRKNDDAAQLAQLPFLTRQRVAELADVHPSTVDRSPLVSVGKRGRSRIYRTADVLAWIAGDAALVDDKSDSPHRSTAADAIRRIDEIRRGRP